MATNRQQPGYSCEECRRRKARCDRVRPQCGTCLEAGTTCVISHNRPARGPKKGQLKALRTRVAMLESQLGAQLDDYNDTDDLQLHNDTSMDDVLLDEAVGKQSSTLEANDAAVNIHTNGSDEETVSEMPTPDLTSSNTASSVPSVDSNQSGVVACTDPSWDGALPGTGYFDMMASMLPTCSIDIYNISSLMNAELDQIYFERFHSIAPILQKQRYFEWAQQEHPSWQRACLRSAMRAVASSLSAAFRPYSQSLYTETRRLLKEAEMAETGSRLSWSPYGGSTIPLEHIQAILLLAHYELLCVSEHEAMLSAGKAFRMVQMTRLYNVDNANTSIETTDSFVEAEEKRRTFWLAFSFDRFLCARDEIPLTLHEEMLNTRLPAPEINFQQNQAVCMGYLSEAISSTELDNMSPFSECMVLATLHGRCTAHRRQSLIASRGRSGLETREFWSRHKNLAGIVDKWTTHLEQKSRALVHSDPMILFTHMLAYSAVIHLSATLNMSPWHTEDNQHLATAYLHRAHIAALEMIQISKCILSQSYFKVHIFLPSALISCVSFLSGQRKCDGQAGLQGGSSDGVKRLLGVLRGLQEVNNLARDRLQALEIELPSQEIT